MYYFVNESTDPKYNLAFEEHAFRRWNEDQPLLILWRNGPTIVVGKHQNTHEEINQQFVEAEKVQVVRRITGGGAVYHDLGNLNYSIISNSQNGFEIDFASFTKPILKALESMGIHAELSGRNDLTIDGKKFSGNAQFAKKGQIIHHGTLLFNSDLTVLTQALNVRMEKLSSKGIQSVRSRVTNIADYLDGEKDVLVFREKLIRALNEVEPLTPYCLGEDFLMSVEKLKKSKYDTWEWNYGESLAFDVKSAKKFERGLVDVRLGINAGKIDYCKIYGDFFTLENPECIQSQLAGVRYDRDAVEEALQGIDIVKMFNIGNPEFARWITNSEEV